MTEPAITTLHVEPAYEPWDVAVDAVCSALETYAAYRLLSGDIAGCAHAAGITRSTAARFEKTLDAISEANEDDDPEEEEAAPDATEAAPDPSERNRHA